MSAGDSRLLVVVGAGGVGKTTLAAAAAVHAAAIGRRTLAMTFDPSLRLREALGLGAEAGDRECRVEVGGEAELDAALLDAKRTFDRLVERYAPDPEARQRILGNRYYQQLAGNLAGILEYMAVERLWEAAQAGRHDLVVLDTPPTEQALDFLEAPRRIVEFLDSGALELALRPWFTEEGRLRPTARLGRLGRRLERLLDELVGIELLRDMAEFFQAFGPLYEGFRERAVEVEGLLRSPRCGFLLVIGPGERRIPEALFFARRLVEAGYRIQGVVVNRVFPGGAEEPGLAGWLGARHREGLKRLEGLLPAGQPLATVPLTAEAPTGLAALEALGARLAAAAAIPAAVRKRG